MKRALIALTLILGVGIAPLSGPAHARNPDVISTPSATETAADEVPEKVTPKFVRRTWRSKDATWWDGEAVQLAPNTGRRHVYIQVRIKGKWVPFIRQTTFKNGIFDFGPISRKRELALRTKVFHIRHFPNRHYVRLFVPGDARYKPISSPAWLSIWG